MRIYKCKGRGRTGAVLHLPYNAYFEDFHGSASKKIKKYLNDNTKKFFNFAKSHFSKTDIEDVILVTGYSVVTSWAAAVFLDRNIKAQLVSQPLPEDQVDLQWHVEDNICEHVPRHTSTPSQVRFLRPKST